MNGVQFCFFSFFHAISKRSEAGIFNNTLVPACQKGNPLSHFLVNNRLRPRILLYMLQFDGTPGLDRFQFDSTRSNRRTWRPGSALSGTCNDLIMKTGLLVVHLRRRVQTGSAVRTVFRIFHATIELSGLCVPRVVRAASSKEFANRGSRGSEFSA